MRFFSLWQKSPIGSIGCNFIYIRAESEEWGGDMSDVVEGFSFFLSLFLAAAATKKAFFYTDPTKYCIVFTQAFFFEIKRKLSVERDRIYLCCGSVTRTSVTMKQYCFYKD